MKDFSKWADTWHTYNHPPSRTVPLTAAELSANEHTCWRIIAVLAVIVLIVGVLYWLKDKYFACGVLFAIGFPFAFLGVYIMALFASGLAAQSTKTVYENVSKPTSFTVQVEKTFGVRNLSCPPTVMSAKNALPDAGAYQCTITNGEDESTLKDVRLIVTADNKVGLYRADGKALVAKGKD